MDMAKKKVVCASCIAFVIALLVNVPLVFVWNLFLNGQGTFNWIVSLAIAASVAFGLSLVMMVKRGHGHPSG